MSYFVSVVIPNYNGEEILKKNLPKIFDSIALYKEGKIEVIVSDDCSIDNSLSTLESLEKKMRSLYPFIKFKILKNDKNLGFASNINRGVNKASGDILILLNTDVFPKNDFLSPLAKHFADPSIFAVGCMDRSIEKGKIVLRGRGLGEWKKGFLVHSRGEVDKTYTLWVSGGSSAFRKSIWEKLGGFDKLYDPFYWEDIDISYRAQKAGYKIIFEKESIVVHEHSKGTIKSIYSEFQIKKIAFRNQFIFVWINITDLDMQFEHMIWLPWHFVKAILRLDIAFVLGFFEALILFPEIIKSSFKYQKLFIKKDKDILPII